MLLRLGRGERPAAFDAFSRVFVTGNPYAPAFTEGASARALLFPTDGYILARDQFEAVSKAAQSVGEERAYLLGIEGWEGSTSHADRELFHVRLCHYDGYTHPPRESSIDVSQNALFSTRGTWGVLVSDEFHALVGGSEVFVRELRERISTTEDAMLDEFFSLWKWHENYDPAWWMEDLLVHLYGEEKGRRLLKRYENIDAEDGPGANGRRVKPEADGGSAARTEA